jgi:hypothetical protein
LALLVFELGDALVEMYFILMFTSVQLWDGGILAVTPDYLAEIRLGAQRVEIFQKPHIEYSFFTSITSAQNAAEQFFKFDHNTSSLSVCTTS